MVSQIFKGCHSNFEIECLNFKSYINLHVLRYANWIHLQNPNNKAMVSQIFKGCHSNFEIECLNFKSFYK